MYIDALLKQQKDKEATEVKKKKKPKLWKQKPWGGKQVNFILMPRIINYKIILKDVFEHITKCVTLRKKT